MNGVLTVDVEDWFHPLDPDPSRWDNYEDRVEAPTHRLLSIMAEHHCRGTFFVLGWVAERHPALVKRILAEGHEVGSHGFHHFRLDRLDPQSFRADLRRSLDALGAAGANDIVSFRAPYFTLTPSTTWAVPILAEEGIRFDSSVFPLATGRYGWRGSPNQPHAVGPLMEFPVVLPTVGRCRIPVTGGFYCRFFGGLTMTGLRRVERQGKAPLFYIHPWEIDVDQPRIPLPPFLRFRHYFRLAATEPLLHRLMEHGGWRPLREH